MNKAVGTQSTVIIWRVCDILDQCGVTMHKILTRLKSATSSQDDRLAISFAQL